MLTRKKSGERSERESWVRFALGSAVFAALTRLLAFLFLHERFTAKSLIGCALIGAGTLLMVL